MDMWYNGQCNLEVNEVDQMKIGLCGDRSLLDLATRAGCSYLEGNLQTLAGEGFDEMCAQVDASKIKMEAFNVMLPAQLKVTGPGVALEDVRAYLNLVLPRAARLGGKIIVFGSSGARNVPEDFDPVRAFEQLVVFLRMAGPLAANVGITIAVEPLRPQESNIINTVRDGLKLALAVGHDNVKCLADFYHMGQQGEGMEGILQAGDMLAHCHIARPEGRLHPLPNDGQDYGPFFGALREIGYQGRLSIEASSPDIEKNLPVTVGYLKDLT